MALLVFMCLCTYGNVFMYIHGGKNHAIFIFHTLLTAYLQLKKQVMLILFANTCTYIYIILTVCRQAVQLLENI